MMRQIPQAMREISDDKKQRAAPDSERGHDHNGARDETFHKYLVCSTRCERCSHINGGQGAQHDRQEYARLRPGQAHDQSDGTARKERPGEQGFRHVLSVCMQGTHD